MQKRTKAGRLMTVVTAGAMLSGLVATSAVAGTDNTSLGVNAGTGLSVTTPDVGDFAATLDGTAKTAYTDVPTFDAVDSRGSGLGWSVTVKASSFCRYDTTLNACKVGATRGTLNDNSLSFGGVSVAKVDSTSSAAPSVPAAAQSAFTADVGSVASAVTIADVGSFGDGMGSYRFTLGDAGATAGKEAKVSVPASAFADTYRSTVTFTIATKALVGL